MGEDGLTYEGTLMLSRNCLCTNVQRAARSIARHFDDALRPLDLTNWQFTLLVALNRPTPPTINTLAQDLGIDRTTLTANLKPLERRALVAIGQDSVDRRVRRVALTEAGQSLLQTAYGVWRQVHGAVERNLSIDDLEAFRENLRAVIAM